MDDCVEIACAECEELRERIARVLSGLPCEGCGARDAEIRRLKAEVLGLRRELERVGPMLNVDPAMRYRL